MTSKTSKRQPSPTVEDYTTPPKPPHPTVEDYTSPPPPRQKSTTSSHPSTASPALPSETSSTSQPQRIFGNPSIPNHAYVSGRATSPTPPSLPPMSRAQEQAWQDIKDPASGPCNSGSRRTGAASRRTGKTSIKKEDDGYDGIWADIRAEASRRTPDTTTASTNTMADFSTATTTNAKANEKPKGEVGAQKGSWKRQGGEIRS